VRRSLRDLASRALWKVGPTRPARMSRDRLTVATFHRVLPERYRREYAYPGLVVTPEELEGFLGFFAHHYAVDTLARSLARWKEGGAADRPLLAVTFDDGQADNFEYARPVVEKAGLRATFFIPAAHVDEGAALWHDRLGFAVRRAIERQPARVAELAPELSHDPAVAQDSQRAARALANWAKALKPEEREELIARVEELAGAPEHPAWDGMMSWEQLKELSRAGHEICSHSLTHPILPQCSDGELEREVAGSKALLEERLQVEVESFCYPNGDYDARVVEAVRAAGYRQAVTTTGGPNRRGTSLFELGRCDMVTENCTGRDGRLSEPRLAWRLSGFYPGAR